MEFSLHDRRRRLPVAPPPGGRLRRQLHRAGYDDADLRRAAAYGTLVHVDHGIWCSAGDDEHLARLRALTSSGQQVASHTTAAALWGMPGYALQRPLHLTGRLEGGRVRRSGLVAHRSSLSPADVVADRGLLVTSPGRTWIDLALSMSLLEGLVLTDALLRPPRKEFGETGDAILTLEEMWRVLSRRRSTPGIRTVRRVAELARVGVDSPQETRLRYAMVRDGLPEPRVNPRILDERGRVVLEPDLAIDEYRIAIQYDGVDVHSDPEQVLKDVRRAERAEALGWLELRITKDHSRGFWRPGMRKIRRALYSRGWNGV